MSDLFQRLLRGNIKAALDPSLPLEMLGNPSAEWRLALLNTAEFILDLTYQCLDADVRLEESSNYLEATDVGCIAMARRFARLALPMDEEIASALDALERYLYLIEPEEKAA